jgi:hypothetical protein
MASQEEIRREEELLRLTQQRAGIQGDILEDIRDIGNVLADQVKNLEFERQERTEIRSLVRDINKTASENYSITLKELGSQKQLVKLTKDQTNLNAKLLTLQNLQQKFSKGTSDTEIEITSALKEQVEFTQNLINNLSEVESQSQAIANNFSVKTFDGLSRIVKDIPVLRQFSTPFENAANASRIVVAENSKLLSTGKGLNATKIEELGLTDKLGGLTGTAAAAKAKSLGYDAKSLGNQKALNAGAAELNASFTRLASAAILGAIVNSFLKLNKAQVEFQRNIGASVNRIDTLNNSLISSVDYIQQANSLVEQFGFNANVAFSQINIQEAAELTQLMGLSAEEANNLAMFSQANGESLKDNAAQAYKNISPLLSQRKVLQEISKVAPSIAMSFGGSAEELATAASNARLLGLNLQQVDNIASGLLDIESSLAAEFEAEVITGKQLNFERARFFALTNDIDGLTKEIGENQEFINSFSTGTRIEQEAIAKSLNLSRDEVSKMIFDQQILNKLSVEEAALKSGMSIEDAKRLTTQESINKSIAKMTEALALPLELMASLVSNSFILYTTLGSIATIQGTKMVAGLAKSVMGMKMFNVQSAKGLALAIGKAAAFAAANPFKALAGLAVAGTVAAGLYSLTKSNQEVEDGMAPASRGPFTITDSFGATAITAKGDGLAVSPNIQREDRNQPTSVVLSDAQIQKIANAVRDGASRATINLDGDRVSSRLQTPMITNTLPGV